MNKKEVQKAVQTMRSNSKERKFEQTIELYINFKNLDLKKPESQLSVRVTPPYNTGKAKVKSIAFVKDKHFAGQIKEMVDKIVLDDQIEELSKKKKELAQLIEEYDVFIAEGPVMLTVGKFLGQSLAPKNKMPRPVTTDPDQVKQILSGAASSLNITNKKGKLLPFINTVIGKEKMTDEELIENTLSIIEAVIGALPQKIQNIKTIYIKETMGPPIQVGGKQ